MPNFISFSKFNEQFNKIYKIGWADKNQNFKNLSKYN